MSSSTFLQYPAYPPFPLARIFQVSCADPNLFSSAVVFDQTRGMLKALSLVAGLQLVSTKVFAQTQTFSADAALAIEVLASGEPGADAGAENTAAMEVSGEFSISASVPDLERQNLRPVGTYLRTCDCTRVRSVVRFTPELACSPAGGLTPVLWEMCCMHLEDATCMKPDRIGCKASLTCNPAENRRISCHQNR